MTRIRDGRPPITAPDDTRRRLLAEADRRGNADGRVEPGELGRLVGELERRGADRFDAGAEARLQQARTLAADGTLSASTLEPELQRAPEPVRRLALEVDALWGNADGRVSIDELDRVAAFYLAALPFFGAQAATLLELASALGAARPAADPVAPSVLALRAAVQRLDSDACVAAQPFASLFEQALAEGDVPGAPGYLRDPLLHSPRWHRLSVLEHTAAAVDAARQLAATVGVDWREAGATMLLHDVGKLLDRVAKPSEGFNYFDHEALGAAWLAERGLPEELRFQIASHLEIHRRSADELIALCAGDRGRVARLVIVACADSVAKGDTPEQVANFEQAVPKLRALARHAGLDDARLLAEVARLRAAGAAAHR